MTLQGMSSLCCNSTFWVGLNRGRHVLAASDPDYKLLMREWRRSNREEGPVEVCVDPGNTSSLDLLVPTNLRKIRLRFCLSTRLHIRDPPQSLRPLSLCSGLTGALVIQITETRIATEFIWGQLYSRRLFKQFLCDRHISNVGIKSGEFYLSWWALPWPWSFGVRSVWGQVWWHDSHSWALSSTNKKQHNR